MQIISRSEAKAKGLKRFFTGKPCKHGHVAERYVGSSGCVECQRVINKKPRKKPKPTEPKLDYAQIGKAIMDQMNRLKKLSEEGIENKYALKKAKEDIDKLTNKIKEQHDQIQKLNQRISQMNQSSSKVPDDKFKLSEIARIR